MTEFKYLTSELAVASQISVADLAAAKQAGFNSIVNNRPDYEEANQPTNQQIEQAARELGLDFHYLPIVSGQLLDSNISDFRQLLPNLRLPVLMYCRSGTRCTHLWALSQANQQPSEQLCNAAKDAGYDLTALIPRLLEQSAD